MRYMIEPYRCKSLTKTARAPLRASKASPKNHELGAVMRTRRSPDRMAADIAVAALGS